MTDTKEKKTRTARNPQSILKGILALPLEDKVAICKELKANIDYDVKLQQEAKQKPENLSKDFKLYQLLDLAGNVEDQEYLTDQEAKQRNKILLEGERFLLWSKKDLLTLGYGS